MKKNTAVSNIEIQAKKPWNTEIEGEISEIKINGQKIDAVHDLAKKVANMIKTTRFLAYTATALAIMCVGFMLFFTNWLNSRKSEIEQLLSNNSAYKQMIEHSRLWKSAKRQKAWHNLRNVQGLSWSAFEQEWIAEKDKKVFSDTFQKGN